METLRTPANNPFVPGSDRVPEIWAGRREQLADWSQRVVPRRREGRYERGRVVLGEPGIGKSVLLARIAQEARSDGHVVVPQIRVPRGSDVLALVAEALLVAAEEEGLAATRDVAELLDRVESLRLGPLGVSVRQRTAGPPHRDLARLLIELSEHAWARQRLVLVRIDEIQNVDDADVLSQLLVAVGDALAETVSRDAPGGQDVERSLPLAVYMSGLPEFGESATSRGGATFTRRFQTELLPPLTDENVEEALEPMVLRGWDVLGPDGPVTIRLAPAAARRLTIVAAGDPYILQLAGQRAWDASTDDVITLKHVIDGWRRARAEAVRHAVRQLDRLPERERRLLEAMAELPPDERTATRLAQAMGYDNATQIGTAAQRLEVTRGLIDRGKPYSFRVPLVERFLQGRWPDVDANGD